MKEIGNLGRVSDMLVKRILKNYVRYKMGPYGSIGAHIKTGASRSFPNQMLSPRASGEPEKGTNILESLDHKYFS